MKLVNAGALAASAPWLQSEHEAQPCQVVWATFPSVQLCGDPEGRYSTPALSREGPWAPGPPRGAPCISGDALHGAGVGKCLLTSVEGSHLGLLGVFPGMGEGSEGGRRALRWEEAACLTTWAELSEGGRTCLSLSAAVRASKSIGAESRPRADLPK